jgi:hypothetical protein
LKYYTTSVSVSKTPEPLPKFNPNYTYKAMTPMPYENETEACERCGGTGEEVIDWHGAEETFPCEECLGTGQIWMQEGDNDIESLPR